MFTQGIAGAIPKMRSGETSGAMTDDPERFEELVREHQAMVFSMACRYLRNRALAEEIAQDVFLQLYRKLPSLESSEHVLHWLRWVTAHRLIAPAVTALAGFGLVLAWLSGATLDLLRTRHRDVRRRSVLHACVALAGIAALFYIVLMRDNLLDLVIETMQFGPEP